MTSNSDLSAQGLPQFDSSHATDLKIDALALIVQLDSARRSGASEREIIDLVLTSGWRPLTEPTGLCDVLDGVLANGRHVPVHIHHARAGSGTRLLPAEDAMVTTISELPVAHPLPARMDASQPIVALHTVGGAQQ